MQFVNAYRPGQMFPRNRVRQDLYFDALPSEQSSGDDGEETEPASTEPKKA